jgi:hypothetical protein
MNISLTKELEALVKFKVRSGTYASDSEVIRDAPAKPFAFLLIRIRIVLNWLK